MIGSIDDVSSNCVVISQRMSQSTLLLRHQYHMPGCWCAHGHVGVACVSKSAWAAADADGGDVSMPLGGAADAVGPAGRGLRAGDATWLPCA